VPCGITETEAQPFGVTSLAKLGVAVTVTQLDRALRAAFTEVLD
jgi:lipoate-protein ligase B